MPHTNATRYSLPGEAGEKKVKMKVPIAPTWNPVVVFTVESRLLKTLTLFIQQRNGAILTWPPVKVANTEEILKNLFIFLF